MGAVRRIDDAGDQLEVARRDTPRSEHARQGSSETPLLPFTDRPPEMPRKPNPAPSVV
jgi:hypothetical protein